MWGLKESHKFEKLVMGMKGERRDRPTEETNALLRTMLQNQNNVAGIPNAGYRKAQVVPYTASGYEYYPEQQ